MQKRWTIHEVDSGKVASLQSSLGISEIICKMLVGRGVTTFDEAKSFFRPSLQSLHDPFLMKDMDKAVNRVLQAIDQKERILVFGDYDGDGTTSVACMYSFLVSIYESAQVDFYIPHRYREGYGVSKAGIDQARDNGCSLIIALDCGIKSVDLISYAQTLGIDFIVCDHHLPDENLPPAVAILNAKQADCQYPYKELCGCGVGFKLMTALANQLKLPENTCLQYLDLVATAIAADIVPITGENRILTYYGLKKANENPNNGIAALKQLSGLQKEMSIGNLVFMIAPRVNAAGRMDDARKAVEMFIAKTSEEALGYAELLHSDNTDRKETDSSITGEALGMIEANEILINRKSTVVFQPHWHKGVVGIVASRLIEKFYRPTVVLTQSGEIVAGSARSVMGFNLYEAIHACREHLLGYGGHFAAAGMTLLPEQVGPFTLKFEEIVAQTIEPHLLIPEIVIDSVIGFKSIDKGLYNIIRQMEPFGPGNMRPVFVARNLLDSGHSKIVKEEHIRFSLKQENVVLTGIGFNMVEKFPLIASKELIDIVFTIDENEWNGNTQLQLKVVDIRLSEKE